MVSVENKLKDKSYLKMTVDGKFDANNLLPVVQLLQDADDHSVKMMVVIKDVEMSNVLDHFKDKIKAEMLMLHKLDKVAVVTDKSWIEIAGNVENVFLPNILLKTYALDQNEEARNWLLN